MTYTLKVVGEKPKWGTLYEPDGTRTTLATGVPIGKLADTSLLKAIRTNPSSSIGISNGTVTIVWYGGQYCARFFKKGGHTAYYAPVTETDARSLLANESTLRYVKRTTRYVVTKNKDRSP